MTGICDLPQELLTMITVYLHKRDRHQLATTCHNIYQSLIPQLWKEVYLTSDLPHYMFHRPSYSRLNTTPKKPCITSKRLRPHAPFVRLLSIQGPLQPDLYYIVFPRLYTLLLFYDNTYHASTVTKKAFRGVGFHDMIRAEDHSNSANLIRLNPTIKDLQVRIDDSASQLPADFWDAVSTTLTNPTRLQVAGMDRIQGDTLDAFWRACSLFEEVILNATLLGNSTLLPQLTFPRLQRISFEGYCESFDTPRQFAWIRRCPSLTRLHWRFVPYNFPTAGFLEALEQGAWPCLEDLSVGGFGNESELTRIVSQLPPLRRFCLETERFGWSVFSALRVRLFANIKALDVVRAFVFSSAMAVNVLESCVHLEEFKTILIEAGSIDITRPWACLGLKRLVTIFVSTSIGSNKMAFEALSRLTNLEYLDFSQDFGQDKMLTPYFVRTVVIPSGAQSLRWSMDHGLNRLTTLKKLKSVAFEGDDQEIAKEDLKWMYDTWPALEEVRGSTSQKITAIAG
ncbi:hypothetical protein BGZ47_005174 [Haplosporangium gracile]|nr:hypothetical protein BGZ47_005174 [Haplosporangium gracile]